MSHIHIVNKEDTPKMPYTNEQIEAYLNGVYDGSITEYELSEDLYHAIADYLKKGVYEGFGGNLAKFEDAPDFELLTELRENIYMFAAAKNFQQTKDISSALTDGDTVRTKSEFQEIGRQMFSTWNDDWGSSEYNTAIAQASMANKWADIERNKEILPNLSYSTSGGDVCDICAPLDGLTLPVDAPEWDEILPPNHFNCFCIVTQEDADVELSTDYEDRVDGSLEEMADVFKMNSGKDHVIFSDEHPYFDVAPKDKDFARENFGMSVPSVESELKKEMA